jgi:hypothetical protein
MKRFFISLFALTALVFNGCGSGGDNGNGGGSEEYSVVLYDALLDYQQTLSFPAGTDIVGSLPSGGWYRGGGSEPITALTITENLNLYAIANVHEIRTEEQLDAVRNNLTHNYILLNDITLTGETLDSEKGWTPIGDSEANSLSEANGFSGIFNGNYHKITGLFIDITSYDSENYSFIGLFGYLTGTVKNLGVEIGEVGIKFSSASGSYVGGIAGRVNYGTIKNSYTKGDITSYSFSDTSYSAAGGIAGYFGNGTITYSYSTGRITSFSTYISEAGGIAGYLSDGTVENSYSTGKITSISTVYTIAGSGYPSYAGGIFGRSRDSTIKNSYSTGDITTSHVNADKSALVGGIAGDAINGSIENCAAMNENISDTRLGFFQRIANQSSATLTNNFANSGMLVNGSVVTTGAADNENGADKELSLFEDQALYENDLGWEFGNDGDALIWKMPPEGSAYKYPILYWQTEAP